MSLRLGEGPIDHSKGPENSEIQSPKLTDRSHRISSIKKGDLTTVKCTTLGKTLTEKARPAKKPSSLHKVEPKKNGEMNGGRVTRFSPFSEVRVIYREEGEEFVDDADMTFKTPAGKERDGLARFSALDPTKSRVGKIYEKSGSTPQRAVSNIEIDKVPEVQMLFNGVLKRIAENENIDPNVRISQIHQKYKTLKHKLEHAFKDRNEDFKSLIALTLEEIAYIRDSIPIQATLDDIRELGILFQEVEDKDLGRQSIILELLDRRIPVSESIIHIEEIKQSLSNQLQDEWASRPLEFKEGVKSYIEFCDKMIDTLNETTQFSEKVSSLSDSEKFTDQNRLQAIHILQNWHQTLHRDQMGDADDATFVIFIEKAFPDFAGYCSVTGIPLLPNINFE